MEMEEIIALARQRRPKSMTALDLNITNAWPPMDDVGGARALTVRLCNPYREGFRNVFWYGSTSTPDFAEWLNTMQRRPPSEDRLQSRAP